MIILGIETSCDETSAAVLQKEGDKITILSNVVASSADLQSKYGGIIPEQAAREQLRSIIPVIEEAISQSQIAIGDISAIAVTYGPGLIGSLLVGVETAKVLAEVWNKPLIPVNHLLGHFYANWINQSSAISLQLSEDNKQKGSDDRRLKTDDLPTFPCIGLLVSGGHTDLVLFKDHNKYEYLGGTRDDAAGECFDKCARLLGLAYPGGPQISKLAKNGDPNKFKLPSPMIYSKNFDFSFSGLKTAVANLLVGRGDNKRGAPMSARSEQSESRTSIGAASWQAPDMANLASSIETAIVNVLVKKTVAAAKKYGVEQIIVAGGVAANEKLKISLRTASELSTRVKIYTPIPSLCTDNAAMIASAAFYITKTVDPNSLQANPNLSLQS